MNKRVRIMLSAMLLTTCLGWQQPVVGALAAKQAPASYQPAKTGREIKLKGAQNVRDLGGYVNRDGKTVRAHKLLRAASLDQLTKADAQKLVKTYHLKTDIDLRSNEERQKAPDVKIKGVTYKFNPVVPHTPKDPSAFMKGDAKKGMESFYQTAVLSKDGRKAYKALFKTLLATPKNQAVLWHCTAGKDRTGIGAMLVLTALKVDKQTIMNDYLLSNKYLAKSNAQTLAYAKAQGATPAQLANIKVALGVQKSFLNTTYKAINGKYGSVNNYLHKGLGLTNKDLAKLQQNYLSTPKAQVR